MTDYILKAIENVERKAALGRARLVTEREAEQMLAASADGDGTTSTLSAVEAGIDEMERIARSAADARRDYIAIHGETADGTSEGEAAA
jgi:hypothetical protein